MAELSQEAQDAIRRVEKLLRLAAKNSNENEAAAATAKAQEILIQYNLDMATVEANSGASSGKREDAKVKGGLYHYQRDLWRAVADLNFCMYWNMYVWDKDKQRIKRLKVDDKYVEGKGWRPVYERIKKTGGYRFEHRVVGRVVNVTLTRTMAEYLEQTIERLTRERVGNPSEYFTAWAVSFREGMAETIVDKIYERRKHALAEEKRKARDEARRASEAGTKGMSLSTALTISDVRKSEHAANYDFLHGEGAYARKMQREAEYAEAERLEEERYTKWAKANPEEARKLEEAERKRRRSYGPRDYSDRKLDKRDWGAFKAGTEAGKKVGLDPQTDRRTAGALQ